MQRSTLKAPSPHRREARMRSDIVTGAPGLRVDKIYNGYWFFTRPTVRRYASACLPDGSNSFTPINGTRPWDVGCIRAQRASYDDVYRLRRADGQYRWIQSFGEPFRDTDAGLRIGTARSSTSTTESERKRGPTGVQSSRRSPATEQDRQLHHRFAGGPPRLVRRGLP